jgi:hypothetical protein
MLGMTKYGTLLVVLGITVASFGILSANFGFRLPGRDGSVKKPLPTWFGRLWFLGFAVLLICMGLATRTLNL